MTRGAFAGFVFACTLGVAPVVHATETVDLRLGSGIDICHADPGDHSRFSCAYLEGMMGAETPIKVELQTVSGAHHPYLRGIHTEIVHESVTHTDFKVEVEVIKGRLSYPGSEYEILVQIHRAGDRKLMGDSQIRTDSLDKFQEVRFQGPTVRIGSRLLTPYAGVKPY